MDMGERVSSSSKRWQIQEEVDYGRKFLAFKIGILNIFSDVDRLAGRAGVMKFCNVLGILYNQPISGNSETHIIDNLRCEKNEKRFYFLLEIVFSLSELDGGYDPRYETNIKNSYYLQINDLLKVHTVNLAIMKYDNDEIILYPKGEEKLDKELIDTTFSFLNTESSQKFKEALSLYEKENYIKSAESIRRCLEEWLRFKLKNHKGLSENIVELGRIFKNQNIAGEIRNLIRKDFDYLDNYFNSNTKHGDGELTNAENEYLIYQTSVLMRYIDKVLV